MVKGSTKTKRAKANEAMFDAMTGPSNSAWETGPASVAMDEDAPAKAAKPAAPAAAKPATKAARQSAAAASTMDVDGLKSHKLSKKMRGHPVKNPHLRVQVTKPIKCARGNTSVLQKKRRQDLLEKALMRNDKVSKRLTVEQGTKVRKLSLKKMY